MWWLRGSTGEIARTAMSSTVPRRFPRTGRRPQALRCLSARPNGPRLEKRKRYRLEIQICLDLDIPRWWLRGDKR